MTRAAHLVVLLAGCGGAAPPAPAPVLGNQTAVPAPPPAAPLEACVSLKGFVLETSEHEPALGATIVGTGAHLANDRVVLTEEGGEFLMAAPDVEQLTIFYNNRWKVVIVPQGRCDLGTIEFDTPHEQR